MFFCRLLPVLAVTTVLAQEPPPDGAETAKPTPVPTKMVPTPKPTDTDGEPDQCGFDHFDVSCTDDTDCCPEGDWYCNQCHKKCVYDGWTLNCHYGCQDYVKLAVWMITEVRNLYCAGKTEADVECDLELGGEIALGCEAIGFGPEDPLTWVCTGAGAIGVGTACAVGCQQDIVQAEDELLKKIAPAACALVPTAAPVDHGDIFLAEDSSDPSPEGCPALSVEECTSSKYVPHCVVASGRKGRQTCATRQNPPSNYCSSRGMVPVPTGGCRACTAEDCKAMLQNQVTPKYPQCLKNRTVCGSAAPAPTPAPKPCSSLAKRACGKASGCTWFGGKKEGSCIVGVDDECTLRTTRNRCVRAGCSWSKKKKCSSKK